MNKREIFDDSNSQWVRSEAIAWLKLMNEVQVFVPKIESTKRREARRLIRKAKGVLQPIESGSAILTDASLEIARQAVKSVLALFPHHLDLLDVVFSVTVSISRLETLADSAAVLGQEELTKSEREQIAASLEGVLDTFDEKINQLESQLLGEEQ